MAVAFEALHLCSSCRRYWLSFAGSKTCKHKTKSGMCHSPATTFPSCLGRVQGGKCDREMDQTKDTRVDRLHNSIIAIMLGRLRMRIEDCIDVYKRLGTKIFSKKQPFSFLGQNKYSCEKLEEFVKTVARSQSVGTYRANDGGPSLRDPGIVNKGEGESQNRARNRFVPCRV
jgi:hypothetical protein